MSKSSKLYDFSEKVENPQNDEQGDQLAQFLGVAIANGQPNKELTTMKLYTWARELLKGDATLILDSTDVKALTAFIEGSQFLSLWTKGALISLLETKGQPIPTSGKDASGK